MQFPRKRGSTAVILRVFIPDNGRTDGAGLTGLTYASTNLAIAFTRELQSGGTEITGANLADIATIGTWASPGAGKIGFEAVDAAKFPGLYELHFADDLTAFGSADASRHVIVNLYEKTTAALRIGPCMTLVPLVGTETDADLALIKAALPIGYVPGATGGVPILRTFADKGMGVPAWLVMFGQNDQEPDTAHQIGEVASAFLSDGEPVPALNEDGDSLASADSVASLATNAASATELASLSDAVDAIGNVVAGVPLIANAIGTPPEGETIASLTEAAAGGPSANDVATATWSAARRTLTGTGGAIGPSAGANLAPIPGGPIPPQQTLDLSACLSYSGQYATVAGTDGIAYTIYRCHEREARAVPGHDAVPLTVADVLFDTLQNDGEASGYNFRFRPDETLGEPFPHAGQYLVTVTFSVGNLRYYCNFRVEARW